MLSQQIITLQDELQMSGKKIAEYAGFSKTVISALKSGAKTPKKDSSIISKYCSAVCRLAADTGKTGRLAALTGAEANTSPEQLKASLIRWLYNSPSAPGQEPDAALFSDNLRRILFCLNMTGIELAGLSGISKSQMARIINNEVPRLPEESRIQKICSALILKTAERQQALDICRLLGCPLDIVQDEARFRLRLYRWLCYPSGCPDPDISDFLRNVQKLRIPADSVPLFPENTPAETFSEEGASVYYGMKGLQDAAVRFLTTALAAQRGLPRGKTELCLYSSQNMDWILDPSFFPKWASLMSACVEAGIRIRIIHNINRSLTELTEAVNDWLPLYMSGMIESYYIKGDTGDIFSNTLFLSPLQASISAGNPVGSEPNGVIRYDTDKKLLRFYKKQFSALLRNSKSFLRAVPGLPEEDVMNRLVFSGQLPDIGILADQQSAVVVKVSHPRITFTIFHPSMKKALLRYTESPEP